MDYILIKTRIKGVIQSTKTYIPCLHTQTITSMAEPEENKRIDIHKLKEEAVKYKVN